MSHSEGYDILPAKQWKRQLDMDRPCGAVSSEETCWLCYDFVAWNAVMRALDIKLAETRPGTLLLRWTSNAHVDSDSLTRAREASSLASWLLCHHPCVQELNLSYPIRSKNLVKQLPFQIYPRPQSSTRPCRKLRALNISLSSNDCLDLQDLDAIVGLEALYIHVGEMGRPFAAQIDALMERNCRTLKLVEILDSQENRDGLRMIERLVACESLTLKAYVIRTPVPDIYAVRGLMRDSANLKHVTLRPIVPANVSVIASALETNRTLTRLSLGVEACRSLGELFTALEVNECLKELFLHGYPVHITGSCARAVASALKKNNCLQGLDMGAVILHDGEGLGQWTRALSKNCSLQFLNIACWHLPMSEVSKLCEALRINKSLRALKLSAITATEEERTSLALQLLKDECYDRVQCQPWTEPYLRILSPVLASSVSDTKELCLSDIGQLSHDSVSQLFNALVSNKKVKRLTVAVRQEPDHGVALLCGILKKNRSIQFLSIEVKNENSANEVLRALAVNTAITNLEITFSAAVVEETTAAFSDMLSRNNALTSVSAYFDVDDARPFMEAFAQGLSANRVIINFGYRVPASTYCPPGIFESVQRNKASLNRALDFVLERREDRHCAGCFELFFGRSCLMTNLVAIAGLSDAEARMRVAAAENRRREKYLVLTGVIRGYVVCWPADTTQIDALNWDCWHSIVRYLNVTDVCSE
ncbi:hypothetical protein MTO96_050758 [Rhipicephalus appendiculatus]